MCKVNTPRGEEKRYVPFFVLALITEAVAALVLKVCAREGRWELSLWEQLWGEERKENVSSLLPFSQCDQQLKLQLRTLGTNILSCLGFCTEMKS